MYGSGRGVPRDSIRSYMCMLLAAAGGAHFMLAYHIVIDSTMITNALQTDWHETRALLGWQLLATLLVGADGEGLSKRLGSLSIMELRDGGYEPLAIVSLHSALTPQGARSGAARHRSL